MNKIALLTSGCLLASGSVLADGPVFRVGFSAEDNFTQENFSEWKVIDSNDDQKTWLWSEDGMPSRVYYQYHSANQADDWFISPEITIPATGTYLMRFVVTGASYGESLDVYMGNAATVEAMTIEGPKMTDIKGNLTPGYMLADFNAGDRTYIGFHCVSPADKWRLYLNSVELVAVENPCDIGVSEILSPISGEGLGQEDIKVKIKNYTDIPVDGFDVCYIINDGTPVTEHVSQTLAGNAEMEYTFTAKGDFSTPRGKYDIKAYTVHEGDISETNDAATLKVIHVAPAGVPYIMGFEPDDDTSNFIYLNLNNDDGDWSVGTNSFFSQFSRTGDGYLAYNYNRDNAGDDWVFIDPLEVEAGKLLMKFWYSATENHTERMRVCWGNAPTPEAMTNTIVDLNEISNEHFEECAALLDIPTAQKIYIGFYCYSDKDENWLIVDDLSIESVNPSSFDVSAGQFSGVNDFYRAPNRRDVTVAVVNNGITENSIDVTLYVDGNQVASRSVNVNLLSHKNVTFENVLTNLGNGRHTVKAEVSHPSDNDLTNNSVEKEFYVVEQAPAIIYDFENGEFPESLTWRIEDSNTLAPGAAEMFDENGVGFVELSTHYLMGECALALSSWFDSDGSCDRYLVMPKVTPADENCYFIFEANSMSTTEFEKFNVEVSTGDDYWMDYNAVLSVPSASEYSTTYGISLAPYAGKPIYVAIHQKTNGGVALILDNLGMYGNFTEISGISDITSDAGFSISTEGGILGIAGDFNRGAVYTIGGVKVMDITAPQTDLNTLGRGIYILNIDGRSIKLAL